MKLTITKRLVLYFTATLLVFAAVIGILFSVLFTTTMARHNREDLERRANNIAATLSTFLEGRTLSADGEQKHQGQGMGQGGGFGAFLRLADELTVGEVWLVDKESNLITSGMHGTEVNQAALPPDGEALIANALAGRTGFSESFSEAVGTRSFTVSVPAYGSDGTVIAAVLVHAPAQGMQESLRSGLWILGVSLVVALALAAIIAVLLSRRFIRPINEINAAAGRLAEGDYSSKTSVDQQDEIGELARTMNQLSLRLCDAREQQERLEEERQTFYADISHELRTPVTVIRGSLEALKDGKIRGDEEMERYYAQLLSEVSYMQKMVNDLLDFSRLKNQNYALDMEWINLADVLSDAVRSIRRIAEVRGVAVRYRSDIAVIGVHGNYEKLRQMFSIVLDNAVKFSPEGQVVSVDVTQVDDRFIVSIEDHGSGIEESDLPHVFERFYRDTTDRNTAGTGIGLAIAAQVAERHNIQVQLESQIGVGTRFRFVVARRDGEFSE